MTFAWATSESSSGNTKHQHLPLPNRALQLTLSPCPASHETHITQTHQHTLFPPHTRVYIYFHIHSYLYTEVTYTCHTHATYRHRPPTLHITSRHTRITCRHIHATHDVLTWLCLPHSMPRIHPYLHIYSPTHHTPRPPLMLGPVFGGEFP